MTRTDDTPATMIGRTQAALETIRRTHHCLIVAVTGSIACGKSTVSGMLEDFGAPLIDLDRIAREVVMPGTLGYDRIIAAFGAGVVHSDETLDRKTLSGIVFADETKRRVLERITHPLIFDRFVGQLTELSAARPDSVIQAGIPLLIEMNIQHLFDRVIVVYLPREIQLKRLAARDNIPEDKAAAIIASQLSAHEKKPYAHYVIDNSQDRSHTREQVTQVWQRLQQDKKQLYPETDAQ
jgi:dephospho-CoA kinase